MANHSEYSYYSLDDHHDDNSNSPPGQKLKKQKTKTGMTEKNVVPDSLPDQINDNLDVESDWSD